MQLSSKKLLHDMLEAARGVRAIVAERSSTEFSADRNLRWSVERGCEIIGEALSQLRKSDPQTAESLTDWRRIIGFRNVLVHGYAILDSVRTWEIAAHDVPNLIAELERAFVD